MLVISGEHAAGNLHCGHEGMVAGTIIPTHRFFTGKTERKFFSEIQPKLK